MTDILALADTYKCQVYMAKGGREAAERVRGKDVRLVVAVACEEELSAGIIAAFPKPVIAVANRRPCGYCNNTMVEPEDVEQALQKVVIQEESRSTIN